MINTEIESYNYNEEIHFEFPKLLSCKVFDSGNIINVSLLFNRIVDTIFDDFGFDANGKYFALNIEQWHDIETGRAISKEDFYDLSEVDTYRYENVSLSIKFYTDKDYKFCYHNGFDRKLKVSLISTELLNFTENNQWVEIV